MARTSDPRTRMIQSAALLMRERGVAGTAFSDVIEHSGAPRGSIYHHFPGGKAQLVQEATRYAGDFIAAGLAAALETDDPASALDAFTASWLAILREGDFAAGCPVVAAALGGEPEALGAAGAAFARWEGLLADALRGRGVADEEARSFATLAIAAIEGAIVLSRAQRDTGPLERVGEQLGGLAAGLVARG